MNSEEFATALTIFIVGVEAGTVFGRGDAIAAFELEAQVWGGETHFASDITNGHLGMVGQQVVSNFHANGVDVLGKTHAVGKSVELVVQMMTSNTKTLHDVFTHEVDLCVKTLLANDVVDSLKEFLVHLVFDFDDKIKQK